MKTLLLVICLAPLGCFGMDRLSALSMLETGNNDRMVGRAGEISRYQILKPEWRSVTNSTRWTDPVVAKAVTLKLIERRVSQFHAAHHRNPSDFEFYVLWNAPAQVLVRGKVSKVVAERAQRYANLCSIQPQQPKPMLAVAVLPGVANPAASVVSRLN
ncbi:MAG TPA: hypothetical protein VJ063_14180 [Verrucomicrobiae bacterium]|nr:hypothetical protein [Verrucomicrobiae bacterium]